MLVPWRVDYVYELLSSLFTSPSPLFSFCKNITPRGGEPNGPVMDEGWGCFNRKPVSRRDLEYSFLRGMKIPRILSGCNFWGMKIQESVESCILPLGV